MAKVTVVFTASTGLVGRAIRWFSSGRVSHSMIQYPSDLWGGTWVAEAVASGVRKVRSWKSRHHVVSEFECMFDAGMALKKIGNFVGESYDYSGVVIFGWLLLWKRILGRKLNRPFKSTKGMFCSELVARMFMAAGLEGTKEWNPEMISPEDLLEYCEKYGCYFKKVETSNGAGS